MSIFVVAEKPVLGRNFSPLLQSENPGQDITFVNYLWFGHLKRQYPRGLKISQFPKIQPPVLKLSPAEEIDQNSYVLKPDGTKNKCAGFEALSKATKVYLLCDSDSSGIYHGIEFLKQVNPALLDITEIMAPLSYQETDMKAALSKHMKFDDWRAVYDSGYVKAYLDYNWNLNAMVVFGDLLSKLGMGHLDNPVSKYSLQLLLSLQNESPSTEGKLVHLMSHWIGTGAYSKMNLGSAASRATIIENLLNAGFLIRSKESPALYSVSGLGMQFINALHKDCQDPDLPARVKLWMNQGLSSIPKIDKYLKTFFGKQLKFQSGH